MKNILRPNHTCVIEDVRDVKITEKFMFFKHCRDTPPWIPSVNIRAEVTRAISSIARKAKGAR